MAISIARALAKLRFPVATEMGGISKGYIEGLIPQYQSGTSIVLNTGTTYIPALGRGLEVTSQLTLSGLTLTASTWYYLYLYDNAGVPAIELVTTAPAAPYSGSARTKTGDTSRRFMGAFKTGASGLFAFRFMSHGITRFLESINAAPFRATSGVGPGVSTAVSLAASVPPTAKTAEVAVTLTAGSSAYDAYMALTDLPNNIIGYVRASSTGSATVQVVFPVDTLQRMNIWISNTGVGGSISLDVAGYGNER